MLQTEYFQMPTTKHVLSLAANHIPFETLGASLVVVGLLLI